MISTERTLGLAGIAFVVLGCAATPAGSPTASSMSNATLVPSQSPAGTSASVDPAGTRLCRGSEVDWSTLPPVAQAWGKAWNERDDAKRMELLEQALAETADFVDPIMEAPVVGREAVANEIELLMEPGNYFEPNGWFSGDEHHGYMQLRWNFCSTEGLVFDGVDFAELAADGRIQRVTDFFAFEPSERRPVCTPPDGDWTGIPEIARRWAAAGLADPPERSVLIREVFAEGASYVDPSDTAPVIGHAAIEERVAGMLWEGAFFEAAAWDDSDSHHDHMRLRWRLCDQDVPGLEGVDYVELDDAGQFLRVIGFFPWP